jgi:catechol 2,3-dioxygenase-like lactoylglutathione lyase family enzyme
MGIDHVFVAVREMERSEGFYDRVMAVLGFRKGRGPLSRDPHVFYHNRQLAYAPRPASEGSPDHAPYAPGLNHLCFRVVGEETVDRAARELTEAGVEATKPRYYPEYGPDYYATFFEAPDGMRLEVMNFRELRRRIMYDWEARADLQGVPVRKLRALAVPTENRS